MRIKNRTTPIVSISILLGVVALAFMTVDERYVAAPGIACVVMMLWLWMRLWDRDQKIPFFDVGVLCALAIFFYAVYPLVNYWVNGLQFGFLSDARLRKYHILPAELGFFYLRYLLYLFSFVIFHRSSSMQAKEVAYYFARMGCGGNYSYVYSEGRPRGGGVITHGNSTALSPDG